MRSATKARAKSAVYITVCKVCMTFLAELAAYTARSPSPPPAASAMIPHAEPMHDAHEHRHRGQDPPAGRHGLDVAVPHRRQGDHRPPQAIVHRAEDLRLVALGAPGVGGRGSRVRVEVRVASFAAPAMASTVSAVWSTRSRQMTAITARALLVLSYQSSSGSSQVWAQNSSSSARIRSMSTGSTSSASTRPSVSI